MVNEAKIIYDAKIQQYLLYRIGCEAISPLPPLKYNLADVSPEHRFVQYLFDVQ